MFDERRVRRWVDFELGGLHQGLVLKKRSLEHLLAEEEPKCVTREGEDHVFDREVLSKFGDEASPEERRRLRLPVTLRFHADLEDQASLDDEVAAEILRRLEGFGSAYPFRDGKMWIPYSLAIQMLVGYPTVFQTIVTL